MSPDDPTEPGSDPDSWSAGLEGYDRLTFVGRGGTATVYSATRTADGSLVAIKVFDAPESGPFDRQMRASDRLQDIDGVVTIIDQGSLPDNRHYIVSPFASGGSLSDHLQRFGPMSAGQVAEIGAQLANSLSAAHTAGVLHCDLKPSNVLLDGAGTPLLADFGAAKVTQLETASETMAVTILYAAPEVLEGAPATERSDVYSLGLTLQTLTLGTHPFGGTGDSGLATLINRICTDGVPDPADHGVPAGLASVLRRATALDPDDRYTDAGEFADALTVAAERLDEAQDITAPRQAKPSSGGNRRRWALVAALVLGAAVIGGAVAIAGSGDEPADEAAADDPANTTVPTNVGEPVTEANGILGPLYAIDEWEYVGQMDEPCAEDDTTVAMAVHADQADRLAGVATPWEALSGEEVGVFMAYLPCEAGGTEVRYVLRAPGRWFTVLAEFPQDQYDRMVGWMRENETSPAPDYTVDEPILQTLSQETPYEGWAIVDRAE